MNPLKIINEFYAQKSLILDLSKNDFWSKYSGSQFGVFWAFAQPLLTILVYWFVFQVGFKAMPLNDTPFLLWLMCGLVAWFFFSEATLNAANCFVDYSYLVKKIVFKVSILPIVKIVSALFIHFFFLALLIFIFFFYGYDPTLYYLQLVYYLFAMVALIVSISYLTSTIVVFFKDVYQALMLFIQFSVWLTPIMWNETMIPDKYIFIFKLNPVYYIISGYRDSLINEIWFWEKPFQTVFFWLVLIVLLSVGIYLFKKMKPHFSDVL